MAHHHMNAKQFTDFKNERRANSAEPFPLPTGVTILQMRNDVQGVIVAIDDGNGGAHVIGDTVGIYRGPDTPSYFQ